MSIKEVSTKDNLIDWLVAIEMWENFFRIHRL
jgi:hypothetical protein